MKRFLIVIGLVGTAVIVLIAVALSNTARHHQAASSPPQPAQQYDCYGTDYDGNPDVQAVSNASLANCEDFIAGLSVNGVALTAEPGTIPGGADSIGVACVVIKPPPGNESLSQYVKTGQITRETWMATVTDDAPGNTCALLANSDGFTDQMTP